MQYFLSQVDKVNVVKLIKEVKPNWGFDLTSGSTSGHVTDNSHNITNNLSIIY